jgi:outer membrane protein OmpA-like peptidoglycan-associated protein
LSTTGAPAGTITITGTVQDDKGQTATCSASVNVEAPPPPPAPKTKTLCSISFDRDKKRPARVDNEAKACLDDVALNLQQQTDASAVVVGEAASTEKKADTLAAQRGVNTKDYLVKEKGIDPSRVQVRTGTQGNKEVENYLVPAGATFDNDVTGTTAVDENSVKAQARTAPARVDNEAKACLDDVALNAQRASDASVVVVGNSAADETAAPRGKHHHAASANLAAQRAVNTKDYLVKEKGIDASRIQVRTGNAGAKEVENYLVPAGASFDTDISGTTAVDESAVKVQPRKAVAARKHHKK